MQADPEVRSIPVSLAAGISFLERWRADVREQLRTHSLASVSVLEPNLLGGIHTMMVQGYSWEEEVDNWRSPTWIRTCRADGSILEETQLYDQTSQQLYESRGSCACLISDPVADTFGSPQIDHHSKDGSSLAYR